MDYGKTFIAAVPKGTALSQIKISFTPSDDVKTEDGKVKAPVTAGQTVGTLNFEMPGETLAMSMEKTTERWKLWPHSM